MADYGVAIDVTIPNNSHTQVIDLVGRDRRVLDVGCWEGDLGVVLQGNGCEVHGLELVEDAARVARERLGSPVVVADLERGSIRDHFAPGSFDVIVFADVLEHLTRPDIVLTESVDLLAPDGRIVISVPHVGHGSLRLALLQGRWRTTETGLLDRTHLRFYTRESLAELVEGAGLVFEELHGVVVDALGVEVEVDPDGLPDGVVTWVRDQPEAYVYQFQASVRRRREGEDPSAPPAVTTGVRVRDVRPHDDIAIAAEQAWYERLRERDRVIGLEAAAETAARRDQRNADRIAALKAEVAQLTARVEEATGPSPRRLRRVAGRVKRRLTR